MYPMFKMLIKHNLVCKSIVHCYFIISNALTKVNKLNFLNKLNNCKVIQRICSLNPWIKYFLHTFSIISAAFFGGTTSLYLSTGST